MPCCHLLSMQLYPEELELKHTKLAIHYFLVISSQELESLPSWLCLRLFTLQVNKLYKIVCNVLAFSQTFTISLNGTYSMCIFFLFLYPKVIHSFTPSSLIYYFSTHNILSTSFVHCSGSVLLFMAFFICPVINFTATNLGSSSVSLHFLKVNQSNGLCWL